MEKMSATQVSVLSETPSDVCDVLIGVCDARKTDYIAIAGRRHVDLLIELCQRGFARAACQAAEQAPSTGEPADVLLVPSISSDAELLDILAKAGRSLRAGGTLVLRDERGPLGAGSVLRLHRVLAANGFRLIKKAPRHDRLGEILCARKLGVTGALAAA
jgi:hypothetical protein